MSIFNKLPVKNYYTNFHTSLELRDLNAPQNLSVGSFFYAGDGTLCIVNTPLVEGAKYLHFDGNELYESYQTFDEIKSIVGVAKMFTSSHIDEMLPFEIKVNQDLYIKQILGFNVVEKQFKYGYVNKGKTWNYLFESAADSLLEAKAKCLIKVMFHNLDKYLSAKALIAGDLFREGKIQRVELFRIEMDLALLRNTGEIIYKDNNDFLNDEM